MSSFWDIFKTDKGKTKEKTKVKVLQDYRVYFSITMKDKIMLGKIQGQAIISSESPKKAEEYLKESILESLSIEIPYQTQAVETIHREGMKPK